ncbi:MAG: hypothetical protein JJLCMIEE_02321 [Acidimicrobiales bacterium]|nr:MAG: coenzyme F420 hydrogenase [Actinomycetota bacterium]MBV6509252.1 hypothetical protein [Acidimicrobiales bacterium]RIK04019.1 MAG: coenzyme F420 hydrogenase [Acidobacteriota bacterium]
MRPRITTIRDIAERQLCAGCGVCAYLDPDAIRMVDDVDQGRRPLVLGDARSRSHQDAFAACPGRGLAHRDGLEKGAFIEELLPAWGPVLEVYEGYAADHEIRAAGSSGGVGTALALHCLVEHGMQGVLHIAARPDIPYLNETVFSTDRESLLAATGSRYAPASPCDRLDLIEEAAGQCVFMGKPCDVAAAAAAGTLRPRLARNTGLTLAIFCAGAPATRGTLEMLEQMGIPPIDVRSLRYRGNGWPGKATVRYQVGEDEAVATMSYAESWGGVLQQRRPWRCHVCADHTGEFADIAVGDPWYRPIEPDEPGRSLVLVRSERGRRLFAAALASGCIVADQVAPSILPQSQPNLLRTRGALWGRMLAARAIGVPVPEYRNMATFGTWRTELTWRAKAQSVLGTVKRVLRRRLHRRLPVQPWRPASASRDGERS